MTTLRRRTASETGTEELLSSDKTANGITLNKDNIYPTLTQATFYPTSPTVDAYYKKTDETLPQSNNPLNSYYFKNTSVNSATYNYQGNSNIRLLDRGYKSTTLEESNATSIENMASRDRTQEFARIIRSQQGNLANGSHPLRDGRKPKDFRNYADFMQRSKLISRNISSTYAKLEKLAHLAKKRSLFDDTQDPEIQELTGIIRHDLTSLTKQLEDLQMRSRTTGSIGNTGHLQKHSANLVSSLQTKVASIAQKFKDVLEVRTESLKKQAQRREHFTGGISTGELPPQAVTGHHQGSVLLADEAAAVTRSRSQDVNLDVAIDMSNFDTSGGRLEGAVGGGGGTVYQQQLHLMEEQDAYLQSRADTMKTIESTIVELGQMFTQLATMVKEQEELVHRIDSNVDDADLNVEAAHTEILKYFKSVSSNRWLMAKVFGVVIIFVVLFVVFMA